MQQKETEKKEDSKNQLECTPNRNPTQIRSVGRILNAKDHKDSCLRLLKFIADSDLTLTQVNGQRKLGPPPGWTGPPPNPKCEIFVGSIPRNYYEPEIVQIFSTVGRIYELRLMMDFSGTNRGYCFIMYATEEEAARAIKELDQFEIYPGKRIGVMASVNNRRLFMNHLPPDISTETIIKRIYEITDDIEKVAVYRNLEGILCYVLVSYMTHRGAAMGRRRLVPESATLFPNCEVNVEWANPNITPWNVYEENGTCDKDGKIEIEKKLLLPMKLKNSVLRSKQSKLSKCKSHDQLNRKTRAIKAAPENFKKTDSCSMDHCSLEQGQSASLALSNVSLAEIGNGYRTAENSVQTWRVNGNLRNAVEQSSFCDNPKKNYVQYQSNMILPSISDLLKEKKGTKRLERNEPDKYSGMFNHQIAPDNMPNTVYTELNNYTPNYCCQCDVRGHRNSILRSLNPSPSGLVDNLIPKMSGALIIPEGNDNRRQICLENNVNNMRGNTNVLNGLALVDPNYQYANHYPYNNYYHGYVVNGTEQNGAAPPIYLTDQILRQNLYNNRGFANREPSREHLPQQFLSGHLKSVGWYPKMADSQPAPRENRNFPELPNGFYDYQVYSNQNAKDVGYFDKTINGGPVSSTAANFSDTFACNNPGIYSVYGNNGIFMGNELLNKDIEKGYMQQIMLGSNANIKVNY